MKDVLLFLHLRHPSVLRKRLLRIHFAVMDDAM